MSTTGISSFVLHAKHVCLATLLAALTLTATPAHALTNAFFAMDTGTQDARHTTIASQVELVKTIGFAGFGPIYNDHAMLQDTLQQLDKAKLTLNALYIGLSIESGKAELTPEHNNIIQTLKGRDTILWVYIKHPKNPAAPKVEDAQVVGALQQLSDLAAQANLRIALYPHAGFWIERTEEAVRVAQKVNRPNLGVTFNLCHWLMVDGKDLNATLQAAKPYLFVVTINGAGKNAKDWDHLIQPLDQGDYNVASLLQSLHQLNYSGPIGLQHYGIKGSAQENLRRSMTAWKQLSAKASASVTLSKENQ